MKMLDGSQDFNLWFNRQQFGEQQRSTFATVWDAALESVKNELDDEWDWLIDSLKSSQLTRRNK